MYDHNSTKVRRGRREVYYCKVLMLYLKVDCDKVKEYTIKPKATTKIISYIQ